MSNEPLKAGWLGSATLVANVGRWSAGTARLEFGFWIACCTLAHENDETVLGGLSPKGEEVTTYVLRLRSLIIVIRHEFRAPHERIPLLHVTWLHD